MDTVVKKSNKENSKPEADPKKAESRNVITKHNLMKSAPLRSKNDLREENTQIKPSKQTKSNNSDPMQRKTLSQTFRTEQTLRHRKLVLETQKPPSSVPPKPLLPGTYKGRVVQSKIDCFRKPPTGQEQKPVKNKTKAETAVLSKSSTMPSASRSVQSSAASRMKSGSGTRVNMQKTVSQRQIQIKVPTRTATTSNKPPASSNKPPASSNKPPASSNKPPASSNKPPASSNKPPKPPATSNKPPATSNKPPATSNKPPATSNKLPVTKPPTIFKKPVAVSAKPPKMTSFIKKKEPSKSAAAASEQKLQKPVSSSISQYRIRVESAEERREKLAEWLASKGKTMKRPAMKEKAALQTCELKSSTIDEAQIEESKGAEVVKVSETENSMVPLRKPAYSNSPSHILNTTLDLLDNSDTELPTEPQIRMESLVINLCEQLEAMETPSSCERKEGESTGTEVKVEMEMPEYEILEEKELKEEKPMDIAKEEKKEEKDEKEVKETIMVKMAEEKKSFDSDEEEKIDSKQADVLDACVVKYSIKTTPFLQSVRKRMEGEMAPGTPGSRRKSSIKDLKFLTPVRRSSRIHMNSSRLPGILNEHDPCVSSLAELELMDAADSNAYIYRKNPALLQHLPDQCSETQSTPANKHPE